MPGKVIGTEMFVGFPGSFARNGDCVIAARTVLATDSEGPAFGAAVVLNADNTVSDWAVYEASGTTSLAKFEGVAVREVKTPLTYYPSPTTNGYQPGLPCDVITRGSVCVKCAVGTPTAGGAVYIRRVLNGGIPLGLVGSFEADADGGNSIEITTARWTTGKMDANRVAEITLLTRNNP
jgi:hypothetical protein